MRKNSIKNTRINGEVLKELSNIIRGEIKDPRIQPHDICRGGGGGTGSEDLQRHISACWATKQAQKDTLAGLKECGGLYPQRSWRKTVNLRNTPEIRFILDQSIEYGVNMSKLIDDVNRRDTAVRRSRMDGRKIKLAN